MLGFARIYLGSLLAEICMVTSTTTHLTRVLVSLQMRTVPSILQVANSFIRTHDDMPVTRSTWSSSGRWSNRSDHTHTDNTYRSVYSQHVVMQYITMCKPI